MANVFVTGTGREGNLGYCFVLTYLKRGDTVVMMSDGVYDAFSDMRGVLSRAGGLSPAELCKRLISAHSNDDKSVMIIKIGAA